MTVTLDEDFFAARMERLGPFETKPHLAVAVSGGADSLALTLLADRWVRSRRGRLAALTVDHCLRPESGAEAAQVGQWLKAQNIDHTILPWHGPKPAAGIQAAAREARYALIEAWCKERGILHVLLAHHLEDQAETVLQRLGRGSGVDGLSAMADIAESRHVRLLRPLLDVPKTALRDVLKDRGQGWIEDPSNNSIVYQRVRLRRLLPALAREGMTPSRLAATATRMTRARATLEQDKTRFLAKSARLDPKGWIWLDVPALRLLPADIGLRVLASALRTVGAGEYPPRLERLQRLWDELRVGGLNRRTFQDCLLIPKDESVLICREFRAVAAPLPVTGGQEVRWDRFQIRAGGTGKAWIGALGVAGFAALRKTLPGKTLLASKVPSAAFATIPALTDDSGLLQVPQLGYLREKMTGVTLESVRFAPDHALSFP